MDSNVFPMRIAKVQVKVRLTLSMTNSMNQIMLSNCISLKKKGFLGGGEDDKYFMTGSI